MDKTAEYIVVGAGPVGLLTAIGIARTGASVIVLEGNEAINDSPRAVVYTDPALVLFDRLGILQQARDIAVHNRQINFVWPNDDLLITVDTMKADPERVHAENLQFGQEEIGRIAMGELSTYPNTEVRFSHRVKALSQGEKHVTLTVETPHGEQTLRSSFVIACDGASSTIRKLLGLEFEGHTWPERFIATNIYYDFNARGWSNVHMICSGPDWGLVAKINGNKGGLWRVTVPDDPNLSTEEIEDRIHNYHYKRILPDDGAYELQSWAPYRVHERTCPTYTVRRVVLAGDAAHICNPCGGRGLVGGLMDAGRLISAIEAVQKGASSDEQFGLYSQERRREFLEVSSPFASTIKAMWERSDPVMQKRDQAEVMKLSVGSSQMSLAGVKPRMRA